MARDKNDPGKRRTARILRGAVLAAILVFITVVGLLHQYGGQVKPVGVDALCPFGGLEAAWLLISTGTLLSKIAWSSFALLAAVLVTALLFRRSFCGGICPLGTLQEGAGWLGRKVLKKRFTIPKAVDRWARWLKAGVLAFIIVMTIRTGTLFIRPADPWATWMHLSSVELFSEFALGLAVLVLSLAGSFVYDRFFCKYLCPMGAALTPFSRIGLFKIKRDPAACIDCKACDKACPVNIEVSTASTVLSGECIDCDKCVNACPAAGALEVKGPGKLKIAPFARVLAVLGIFAALVLISRATGLVKYEQASLEYEFGTHEGVVAAIPTDPASAAASQPSDALVERANAVSAGIKGSDTWEAVIKVSGIPAQALKDRFQLKDEQLSGMLKLLTHDPAFGADMETVRAFIKDQMLKLR